MAKPPCRPLDRASRSQDIPGWGSKGSDLSDGDLLAVQAGNARRSFAGYTDQGEDEGLHRGTTSGRPWQRFRTTRE